MATEPKAGRPSDYMPEVADDICSLLSSGESLLKVCKRPGMPDKSTVFRWLAKHEDFRDKYAKATEARADSIFEEIATIAPTLGQQWLSGQMNNYQNLANVGLGALQGQANAGQTYANNMSQISQQSAALAAANANRPSAMQSAIGGGASGAIAGAGLAKLIGSSTPWGAAIGGGLGLLGSLF